MSDPMMERVLCSRASDLPGAWQPEAGIIRLSELEFLDTLEPLEPQWLPRGQAERNEEFKQWIPYALLRRESGQLAAYPRQGADTRLHGRWSLGLGGHINPADGAAPGATQPGSWRNFLWNGMRRELGEEYPGAATGKTRFLGLIHESRSAVGRVHIGIVFLHEIIGDPGAPAAELAGLQWLATEELCDPQWPSERFELWSQLALQLLATHASDGRADINFPFSPR